MGALNILAFRHAGGNQGLNCLLSSSGGTTVEVKGNNVPVPRSMNAMEPTGVRQGNNNEVVDNKEPTVELNIQDKVPTVWAQGNNMSSLEPTVEGEGNNDHDHWVVMIYKEVWLLMMRRVILEHVH